MTDFHTPDPAALALGYIAEMRGLSLDDWSEGTLDDRAHRLHRLRVLAQLVTERIDAVEQSMADSMDADRMSVSGLGEVVREEVKRERWLDDGAAERMRSDLANSVATNLAIDVSTGEINQSMRNVALAAVRAAYDAIPSFSTLKAAGRRRFNLRMGDYRTSTPGYKVTVIAVEDA